MIIKSHSIDIGILNIRLIKRQTVTLWCTSINLQVIWIFLWSHTPCVAHFGERGGYYFHWAVEVISEYWFDLIFFLVIRERICWFSFVNNVRVGQCTATPFDVEFSGPKACCPEHWPQPKQSLYLSLPSLLGASIADRFAKISCKPLTTAMAAAGRGTFADATAWLCEKALAVIVNYSLNRCHNRFSFGLLSTSNYRADMAIRLYDPPARFKARPRI